MAFKATQDVVRRVMPLLDLLADRTVDKARLLQYLTARSGIDWGVLEFGGVVDEPPDEPDAGNRALLVRDPADGSQHTIRVPAFLAEHLEPLVLAEYKRLAGGNPLSLMAEPLFAHFFAEDHCAKCRWRGAAFTQHHIECRYAGRPINFERDETV